MSAQQHDSLQAQELQATTTKPVWHRPTVTRIEMQFEAQCSAPVEPQTQNLFVHIQ